MGRLAGHRFFSKTVVSAYTLDKFFSKNSRHMVDYEMVLLHSGKKHVFEKSGEVAFVRFLSDLTPSIDPLHFQTKLDQPQKCYH